MPRQKNLQKGFMADLNTDKLEVGKLLSDSFWMGIIYTTRTGFQVLSFIFLARTLGSQIFGEFMAVFAIVNLIAPFVEMGAYNLGVRDISSRNIDTKVVVGNSLFISCVMLPIGLLMAVLFQSIILPSILVFELVFISLGVFYGNRLLLFANGICMAHKKLPFNVGLELISGLCLLASTFVVNQVAKSLTTWSMIFFLQSFLSGTIALVSIIVIWGKPKLNLRLLNEKLSAGFHFAVTGATSIAGSDFDKSLLARLSSFEVSGVYAAAYRIVIIATIPLASLIGAVYPKFFVHGSVGLENAKRLALKLIPLTFFYGLCASLLLFSSAPVISFFIGESFKKSEEILKILGFIVVVLAIQMPLAEVLTGSGYQKTRTNYQIIAAAINLICNLLFIPIYSWYGSVIAIFISQSVLLLLYIHRIFFIKTL
jgi:O-antigen/teichoic acid export membrane protein